MRLELNAEELDLRDAVRQFLASVLPAGIRDKVRQDCRLGREELTEWYRLLDTRGWATPRWPREAGGTGWTEAQHAIFDEELQLNDAPRMVSPGIMMLGPTLLRYGSEEQRRATCQASGPVQRGGHRDSPSPRPARTWLRYARPRNCATAEQTRRTWSRAESSGPPTRTSAT